MSPAAVLSRATFKTSRLIEFCGAKELVAQTGHEIEQWPFVIIKELLDNALDIAEEIGAAPVVEVAVSTNRGEIIIADNGPGIPPDTVAGILDYSVRVSSREAYVSPCRGAQGNALKTIIAMPFALDGSCGEVVIEAQGIAHRITFRVDQLRQEPKIKRETASSSVKTGARITVRWPDSASSILAGAEAQFLQMVEDFGWLNPHLTATAEWNGDRRVDIRASNPEWRKWRACDPTSPHWYDQARFERYMAAHISRDQDFGRDRTVRQFIAEFRGLTGTAKKKAVLDAINASRLTLPTFFGTGEEINRDGIARLLAECKTQTRTVKPIELGVIGKGHLLERFITKGVKEETFKYQRVFGMDDEVPYVVEAAFGWCPDGIDARRIITGVNWSVGIHNPFRSLRRYDGGLDSLLTEQRAGGREPIIFLLHYVCPRIEYTDRGKSAIVVPGAGHW
jgi:hypothetical protein